LSKQPALRTRSVELEIAVDAPVAAVWNALTDPEQLVNWFPLEASGSSEEGGTITFSWDEGCEWSTTIDLLETNSHVRWVDPPAEGSDSEQPSVAVDFYLEARGDKTILRLVHSGFSASSDWDEYYDATEAGWTYFLYNLQHFLGRHPNTSRSMVWERRPTKKEPSEIWRQLFGPEGFQLAPSPDEVGPGDRFSFQLADDAFEGVVGYVRSPANFAGSIEALNDALLFVEVEPGKERRHCGLWLSTYGLLPDRVRTLQERLTQVASQIFGEPAGG
jgi:uncharacterized protein YndB with AHSA1/START domain